MGTLVLKVLVASKMSVLGNGQKIPEKVQLIQRDYTVAYCTIADIYVLWPVHQTTKTFY